MAWASEDAMESPSYAVLSTDDMDRETTTLVRRTAWMDMNTCGYGIFGARSHHTGGLQVARWDGSVGFHSQNIDGRAWRALGTRSADEVLTRIDE
ncbi:DUF1559 domain-containing protein [Pirellula sp. SH-Sr6A]|uniref:DUF1559 family PulG-like putative transporter n=1 Tax=Pirellula sp. SH-Sr6A TaxID=1632865 RepID=UPI0021128D65|nr:DUF1559 domain-containing protein [Pirellula sp. SH-Sr6A]